MPLIDTNIVPEEYFSYPNQSWLEKVLPYSKESCLFVPVWMPLKKNLGGEVDNPGYYTIKSLGDSIAHYFRLRSYKKIVFLSYTEAYSVAYIKPMNKIISYMLRTHYDISLDKFLYVAGAHPIEDNLMKYKDICNMHNIQLIETVLVNAMEIFINNNSTNVSFKDLSTAPRKKLKNFASLNGVPRLFRLVMTAQLLKNNLLVDAHYTLWLNQRGRLSTESLTDIYITRAKKQFPNIAKESLDLLVNDSGMFPMILHSTPNNHYDQRDVFIYDTSYFSIVAETVFAKYMGMDDDLFYECYDFSEKLFRPIKFKHPFVLLARPNSLKVLRDYGYKTFHPHINETYDTIEDDEERLLAIIEEVKRLCSFTDHQWISWQRHIKEIVEYNHEFLNNIGVKSIRYTPNLEEEE